MSQSVPVVVVPAKATAPTQRSDTEHPEEDPPARASPLRRSLRIKNKYNPSHGTALQGDKLFLFSHQHSLSKPIRRCSRRLQLVRHRPNVFIIENFLTDKEAAHLLAIARGHSEQFKTSYTQSNPEDQIYSKERTSTFIFLRKYLDKITRAIEARAAGIVSIPIENVEPLQIVRYTEGQEFTLHHDAGTLINETELQRIKHSSHSSLCSNRSTDSGGGGQLTPPQPQQPPLLPPQQLSSAQYANYYQQWQLKLQEALQRREEQCDAAKAPHSLSCPPPSTTATLSGRRPPTARTHRAELRRPDMNSLNWNVNAESADAAEPVKAAVRAKRLKAECSELDDDYSVDIVAPIRLCSFFVYLTTMPADCGGETFFPKLDLRVRPESGKAILWSNVLPDNALKADPLTMHRALPVDGEHEKIGMNIWIDVARVEH